MKGKEALDSIVWRLTSIEENKELKGTTKIEVSILRGELDRLDNVEKENNRLNIILDHTKTEYLQVLRENIKLNERLADMEAKEKKDCTFINKEKLEAIIDKNVALQDTNERLYQEGRYFLELSKEFKKFVCHFEDVISYGLSPDYRHGDNIVFDRLLSAFGRNYLEYLLKEITRSDKDK